MSFALLVVIPTLGIKGLKLRLRLIYEHHAEGDEPSSSRMHI